MKAPRKKVLQGCFGLFGLNLLLSAGAAPLMPSLIKQMSNVSIPANWLLGFALAFAALGLAQGVYVLPLALYLKHRQELELVKGILLGAGLTLLSPWVLCTGIVVAANTFLH
ncbi:MAG: hypothetical protein ACAI44_12780 [Candidatus Sericytochromatia bacterium]